MIDAGVSKIFLSVPQGSIAVFKLETLLKWYFSLNFLSSLAGRPF